MIMIMIIGGFRASGQDNIYTVLRRKSRHDWLIRTSVSDLRLTVGVATNQYLHYQLLALSLSLSLSRTLV